MFAINLRFYWAFFVLANASHDNYHCRSRKRTSAGTIRWRLFEVIISFTEIAVYRLAIAFRRESFVQ
jgi:hypothetical protein